MNEQYTDQHGHYASTIYRECECGMSVQLTGNATRDAAINMEHERVFHEAMKGQRPDGECDHGILSDCPHYS